ncbi:hypothetical protein HBH64_162120 [Parastagonospora nodorum]|nr:hypothetical protein HBH49_185490 [Parastagonospora nodorum]KAH4121594.1 hypothetical protein HBH47_092670 [Parastagonospora nodorum]KAH4182938.1 hypothetical protein HBH42_211610 [Parastagonospora nodorum]KAH4222938.1 hypothetical protein HBI06_137410 [Parastagonospora nodorum]KAH4240681.1 hypothetical protein HBI05_111320 [Parastagonospora nodorum]
MSTRVPSVITTSLLAVSVVFPVLSLFSVFLRWAARRKTKAGWRLDDWVIVATWIITAGVSIIIWASIDGIGIDYLKVDPKIGAKRSATCVWSLTLLMQAALATVKIAVLLFYMRIFESPRFIMAAWVGIGIVSAWGIVAVVCHAIQGDPISSSWSGGGTFRMDPVMLSLARAGSSLALDIVILAYPIPKIAKLHIPPQRKVAVTLIFALGGFCCVAAAVRLAFVKKTVALGAQSKKTGFAAIATQSQTLIWCIIEPNCSIIAGSLPCYGPLARGRAPESIIRSVRSVISLASGGSNRSNNSNRSNRSKPYVNGQGDGVTVNKGAKTISDSEIELNEMSRTTDSIDGSVREWEHTGGHTDAHIDSSSTQTPEEIHPDGIKVTRTYATTGHDQV